MGHEYMYEVVEDANREHPLNPGLKLGALDLEKMREMETIAEGSILRKRTNGKLMVVVRDRGKLILKPLVSHNEQC